MKKIFFLSLTLLTVCFIGEAKAATLSLSPSSGAYAVGDTFDVAIMLDTAGVQTDGVDIYYLKYNPALLQVVDSDSKTTGVQITAGTLYQNIMANKTDSQKGTIDFSQVSAGGTSYKGSGTLATIKFKVLAAGAASLKFDFTNGSTVDTNVAGGGKDLLTAANSASFTLTSGSQVQTTEQPTTPEVTQPTPEETQPTPVIAPTPTPKISIWDKILAFFQNIGRFFSSLFKR